MANVRRENRTPGINIPGNKGWRARRKLYIVHVVERARRRRISSSCVYNGGSKNEAKRGEESWPTVASGSGPSLSKSTPRSPPTGHSLSIRYHAVVFRSVHLFFFLFLSRTRYPRNDFALPLHLLQWPPASFPFTLFYGARAMRSGFSLTFADQLNGP